MGGSGAIAAFRPQDPPAMLYAHGMNAAGARGTGSESTTAVAEIQNVHRRPVSSGRALLYPKLFRAITHAATLVNNARIGDIGNRSE
jgi:hypothetical protein